MAKPVDIRDLKNRTFSVAGLESGPRIRLLAGDDLGRVALQATPGMPVAAIQDA